MTDAPPPTRDEEQAGLSRNWTIAIITGLSLIIAVLLYFGLTANLGNQDRLSDNPDRQGQPVNLERQCGAQSVHDAIKRELFRRAAQLRGSDQGALETIAGHSAARMEAAMMTSDGDEGGVISCSGLLWLDLPPGVVAPGGRRTLSANVEYRMEVSSEGAGDLAGLGGGDSIVSALAELARLRSPEDDPLNAVDPMLGEPVVVMPPVGDPLAPEPEPAEPEATVTEGPSFDCRFARTRSENAVCENIGLSSLDRQMAGLFEQSLRSADSEQRALLQQTRSRFLAYRDRCRSEACIAGAYEGRMREIRDIMAGRWQGR